MAFKFITTRLWERDAEAGATLPGSGKGEMDSAWIIQICPLDTIGTVPKAHDIIGPTESFNFLEN